VLDKCLVIAGDIKVTAGIELLTIKDGGHRIDGDGKRVGIVGGRMILVDGNKSESQRRTRS